MRLLRYLSRVHRRADRNASDGAKAKEVAAGDVARMGIPAPSRCTLLRVGKLARRVHHRRIAVFLENRAELDVGAERQINRFGIDGCTNAAHDRVLAMLLAAMVSGNICTPSELDAPNGGVPR